MRFGKGSNKNFEDQTKLPEKDQAFLRWLSQQPTSQRGLTDMEDAQRDAGWSLNDLYFTRAAMNDVDLIPNKEAEYSGGEVYNRVKNIRLQRQLDYLRKRPLQR